MRYINLVVEDELQEHLLRKVLSDYFPDKIIPSTVIGKRGNLYIRDNLSSYNAAAQYIPFLILTDLDQRPCPPDLINDWVNFDLNPSMFFRIAVKEAEAWLLADRKNFASYVGISMNKIPDNSERIKNPKETLISLARKSRKRSIRDDLVPEGTARIGRNYNSCLATFIYNNWQIKIAAENNMSLKRMIERLYVLSLS